MDAEHDPLASHIFVSRRHYRNASDTKGGKRREMNARLVSTPLASWAFVEAWMNGSDCWVRLRDGDHYRSHDAGNVIETHEHACEFKEW